MRRILMTLLPAFFLLMPLAAYGADSMPTNDLTIHVDPGRRMLRGVSKVSLPAGREYRLDLSGLRILSVVVNNVAMKTGPDSQVLTIGPSSSADTVEIGYEFEPASAPRTDTAGNPGVVYGNSIDSAGIALMDGWYPSVQGLSLYSLKAFLPDGYEGISEADTVSVSDGPDGSREFVFSFMHPVGGITLAAGKYTVKRDAVGGTDIAAYFLPEDAALADTYIEYTKKYIEMYEKLIGSYPFKRFAVVENVLPTGYSFPTYTLLGRDVVRLPFIVDTSLGHEILHQWFGNSVYVDYSGGNWSEGLTTYLADHRYEELKGKGWEYRKQILMSFQSYVTPENDFPLKAFKGRTDYASRAIGYGKAAMVFHMLRCMVGDETFFRSVRVFAERNRFREASWGDIEAAFESSGGGDLEGFFKQWIEGKGAPEIEIRNASLAYRGTKAVVSSELLRKGSEVRLRLPVAVKLKEGETRRIVEIEKDAQPVEIETDGIPRELVIDEDYDVFRRLSGSEFPPVISRLFGDANKIFVLPPGREKEYADAAEYLQSEGFSAGKAEEVTYDDLKTSSFCIFGFDNPLARRLYGVLQRTEDDFHVALKRNPFNSHGVIALVDGLQPGDTEAYMRRLTHYGKYSVLSFRGGKNVRKTTDESSRGIGADLSWDVPGVEIPRLLDIADVAARVGGKKIVYAGEGHDRFEHHRVQYELLRELHGKNKKVFIGMEMFQKPFQQALDDYISGAIDEKEFLKKSEYFKRWGYDYQLYREILLYAREFRIPVVALNIRNEIVTKVAKEGLLSLTEEERKEIPPDMDLSDIAYKERLKTFFEEHKNSADRNFDFFYEAQVLWDEAMAHNLDAYMKKNPEYEAVVIVGMGHLMFGSGIPKRAFRLNGEDYAVILNDSDVEKNIADFVLFPPPISPPETPKLMVLLKEVDGKVRIAGFSPGSISEKAGLKKDDRILSLDNDKIETIDDVKIFLLYKKKGDTITVKVLRKRFLFGPVERTFKISL